MPVPAECIRERPKPLQMVSPANERPESESTGTGARFGASPPVAEAEPWLYKAVRVRYNVPMAEPIEPASFAKQARQHGGPDSGPTQMPEIARTDPGDHPARSPQEGLVTEDSAALDRAAVGDGAPARALITTNIPWPRLARADNVPDRSPGVENRGTPRSLRQWRLWIAAQICGFGLLLGGYFLGRSWPSAPAPQAPSLAEGSGYEAQKSKRAGGERVLDAANRALKAERGRDYQAARTIYEEMINRQEPMPWAEYRLALLLLHQGDLLQTEIHLNRAVLAGDDVADCSLLRASLAGMNGNYADVSTQLAAAVRAQPFNAKFCFCWGESLRRAGRLTEAIERLTQTLDRPDNAAARELYLFKLRLAKVESGGDGAFDAEVAAHVDQPNPGGDWLLLSAAREIGRRNFGLAAERLQQAKGTLPPVEFSVYVQDYLFQTQAARSELSAVLNGPPPVSGAPTDAPLQDPAVWTAAEADPAVWPPFLRSE